MKVRIVTTVDIDPEAWAYEYGVDRKDVRDDVKAYFEQWLQDHVHLLGLAPDNAA